jgi:glycosyltransferase involved in cell wall biosynthesis
MTRIEPASVFSASAQRAVPAEGLAMRRALFLFSSDRIEGAQRVTRALAREAARSESFDHVECLVLHGARTGTLDDLLTLKKASLHYTNAATQIGGLFKCLLFAVKGEFTLVFSSHMAMNALCSVLRRLRLLRTRKLVTRESTMSFERDFGWKTRLVHALYRFYGSQDLIICQTDRMLASLCERVARLAPKCTVLQNPIELDRIHADAKIAPPSAFAQIPAHRRKIVWCGRLIGVKRPLRAIEALRALHDQGHEEMHLVMVGDGPLRDELNTSAELLGVSEFITWMGHTKSPASVMARCEVGLLTSEVEGFPNVVLEMLASGVRGVVTTDCAGGLQSIPRVSVVDSAPQSLAAAVLHVCAEDACGRDPVAPEFQTPRLYLHAMGLR